MWEQCREKKSIYVRPPLSPPNLTIFSYITDNIIIKGTHKTKCSQSGGEKFISTIIASRTIKIFKKNIVKKLGPSPRSWFDRLNPQSHLSFIFKKVLNTDCLPH